MTIRNRVIATRPCAWCPTGKVIVTTATAKRDRDSKRFCGKACARAAGGITHGQEWGRKMQRASAVSRKRLAFESAVALMENLPPAEAARRIYEKAYSAGWNAGKKTGIALEYRRLVRMSKRGEAA